MQIFCFVVLFSSFSGTCCAFIHMFVAHTRPLCLPRWMGVLRRLLLSAFTVVRHLLRDQSVMKRRELIWKKNTISRYLFFLHPPLVLFFFFFSSPNSSVSCDFLQLFHTFAFIFLPHAMFVFGLLW